RRATGEARGVHRQGRRRIHDRERHVPRRAATRRRGPHRPPRAAGVPPDPCAVPPAATSDAGIDACSCVPLTKVVVRAAPFQRTTDALTNPLPVTVMLNAEAPAVTLDDDTDSTPGTGFAIVNVKSPEAPPPGAGVHTDTCAVPVAAT